MSVSACVCSSVSAVGVNIFKNQRFRDRYADVDETWQVYSMGRGTQLLGSGILNFGPSTAQGHPKFSLVGRDDPPQMKCLSA